MAQYKATLFFQGGSSGWTERYWPVAPDIAGAALNLVDVAAARAAILHTACNIISGTLSDITIRGDSIAVFTTIQPGTAVDAAGYLDLDNAVLNKWTVGSFTRNKTFLRGIPLDQTLNGKYNPTVLFSADVQTWQETVVANMTMPVPFLNPTPPPKYLYTYGPIFTFSIRERLARRKTGRPFDQPRGRRIAP